jgi:hypothetical protein
MRESYLAICQCCSGENWRRFAIDRLKVESNAITGDEGVLTILRNATCAAPCQGKSASKNE